MTSCGPATIPWWVVIWAFSSAENGSWKSISGQAWLKLSRVTSKHAMNVRGRSLTVGTQKVPLRPLEQPATPNHCIHMDLFGPLATSGSGKKYVMVITDAFTKYVELVAIPKKEATVVARAIMETWITRYSTPKEIVTDVGKEFANNLLNAMCKELQILHKQTSPYHP